MSLERRVSGAAGRIRWFAEVYGRPYIMFSGGRDSTALLLLSLEALGREGIRGVVFVEVTGNTDRCNVGYVYRVVEELGLGEKLIHLRREDLDFFEALVRWGLPGKTARWCWREFKVRVLRGVRPPVFLAGVKHSDSLWRERSGWARPKLVEGMLLYSPIHDWSDREILEYIRLRGLEPSPCYGLFGHSGNCMYCPFRTLREVARTVNHPYWGPRILEALSRLRNEKGRAEYRRWARHRSQGLGKWVRTTIKEGL